MPIEYISTEDAIAAQGLRMTVVSAVPSPWGEAAKGLLYVKGLPWKAVRYNAVDKRQSDWTGYPNAPTLVHDDDKPLNGWRNILEFLDSQPDTPILLPDEARQSCLELSELYCGQDGLGWHRRLQGVHAGLNGDGGFALPIAQYLGFKYGYSAELMEKSTDRMKAILESLVSRLKSQREKGSDYFVGERLTCVDIYNAAFMAFFDPLPDNQCAMHPKSRAVFEQVFPETDQAFDPILLAHRDYIYSRYLELPLSL